MTNYFRYFFIDQFQEYGMQLQQDAHELLLRLIDSCPYL